jgi:hypothetical protein
MTDEYEAADIAYRNGYADGKAEALDEARTAVESLPCETCHNIDGHAYDCPEPRDVFKNAVLAILAAKAAAQARTEARLVAEEMPRRAAHSHPVDGRLWEDCRACAILAAKADR